MFGQPTVPTALSVVSTSALDTQNVFYEGIRVGGFQVIFTPQALTGTMPVVLGSGFSDHIRVTKFYLSSPAYGEVDLRTAPLPGEFLARIPPGYTYSRYLNIQLWPTPAGDYSYNVDAVRTMTDLVQPTDEPLMPEDFHWLLVEGSLLKEWTKRDDDRRVAAEREYTKGLSALRYFINCQGDEVHVSGRRTYGGLSRFGPYYPATRD